MTEEQQQEEIEEVEAHPVGFVTESIPPRFLKSTITFNEGVTGGGDTLLNADWRNKKRFVIDIAVEGKLYTSTKFTLTIDGVVFTYYGYFRHHVGADVKNLIIVVSDSADRVGIVTIRYIGEYFDSSTSGASAALPEISLQRG